MVDPKDLENGNEFGHSLCKVQRGHYLQKNGKRGTKTREWEFWRRAEGKRVHFSGECWFGWLVRSYARTLRGTCEDKEVNECPLLGLLCA